MQLSWRGERSVIFKHEDSFKKKADRIDSWSIRREFIMKMEDWEELGKPEKFSMTLRID